MDTATLKLLGVAGGGLLLGSGVTFLLTKRHYKRKYEKIADEEIESVKRVYKLEYDATLSPEEYEALVNQAKPADDKVYDSMRADQLVPDPSKPSLKRVVSEDLAGRPIYDVTPPPGDLKDLNEMLADYHGTEDGPTFSRVNYQAPVVVEEEPDPFFQNRDSREPYIISVEEFMTEKIDIYTKEMLTYYEGDKTLVDQAGHPIDDIEFAVGPEALNNFGNHSGDTDIVYVRKEEGDIDFEITKDPRRYEEIMLSGEPREDRIRKRDDE